MLQDISKFVLHGVFSLSMIFATQYRIVGEVFTESW